MEKIEVWIAALAVLFFGGLFGSVAYSAYAQSELVKAAIAAKVDPLTMCMLTKR